MCIAQTIDSSRVLISVSCNVSHNVADVQTNRTTLEWLAPSLQVSWLFFSLSPDCLPVSLHPTQLHHTDLLSEAGHEWAGGKSVKKRRSHRRTRSGRVVVVPDVDEAPKSDERTGLLDEPSDNYGTASA
jgi:hypothetical protein